MPRTQTYQTHRHTPTLTMIVWALALVALVWFLVPALREWSLVPGLVLLTLSVAVLGQISRRYILRLQDRIIRLEMRARVRELMGPDRAAALDTLRSSQVVALRFAGDEELPALMDRAAAESLSPDQIKRAIRSWRGDFHRT